MGQAQGRVEHAHLDIYVNDNRLARKGIVGATLAAYNTALERAFANGGENAPSMNSRTGQKLPIRVNPGEFSFNPRRSNGIWQQVKTAGDAAGSFACKGAIPKSFFEKDKITEDIDIVILLRAHAQDATTVKDAGTQTTRTPATTRSGGAVHTYGFVLLKDLRLFNAHPENFIYTEGLCTNQPGTGLMMMDVVHYLCWQTVWTVDGFQPKLDGAKLSALCYVIPYYFNKFSYRFRGGDGTKICGALAPSDTVLNSMVPKLPGIKTDDESDIGNWAKFKELLQKLGKAHPWHDDIQIQKLFALRDYEYADIDETRLEEIKERFGLDDQGYEMYFCMLPGSNPLAGVSSRQSGIRPTKYTLTLITTIDSSIVRAQRKAAVEGVKQRRQGAPAQMMLGSDLTSTIGNIDKGKPVEGERGGRRRRRKTRKRALRKRHRRKTKHKRRRVRKMRKNTRKRRRR